MLPHTLRCNARLPYPPSLVRHPQQPNSCSSQFATTGSHPCSGQSPDQEGSRLGPRLRLLLAQVSCLLFGLLHVRCSPLVGCGRSVSVQERGIGVQGSADEQLWVSREVKVVVRRAHKTERNKQVFTGRARRAGTSCDCLQWPSWPAVHAAAARLLALLSKLRGELFVHGQIA